jgi:hypothetical protein
MPSEHLWNKSKVHIGWINWIDASRAEIQRQQVRGTQHVNLGYTFTSSEVDAIKKFANGHEQIPKWDSHWRPFLNSLIKQRS